MFGERKRHTSRPKKIFAIFRGRTSVYRVVNKSSENPENSFAIYSRPTYGGTTRLNDPTNEQLMLVYIRRLNTPSEQK